MVSASTPPSRSRRKRPSVGRWVIIIILLLTPLLIAEASVRVLIATHRLPVAASYFRVMELTWTNLQRRGPADVLIMGDSVAQSGFEPAYLGELLGEELGEPPNIYNVAIPDSSFSLHLAMVRELDEHDRLPTAVIIGFGPWLFRGEATYQEQFLQTPMGSLFTNCEHTDGYVDAVDCHFAQASALWRWRGRATRLLEAISQPYPTTFEDDRGFLVREDGYRQGAGRTEEQLRRQLPRALDRASQLEPMSESMDAYERLVEFLEERGRAVIPVMLPIAPMLEEGLNDRHPEWTSEWETVVNQLEERTGVEIVDPAGFGPDYRPEWNRDTGHLSHEGALAFMDRLWETEGFRERIVEPLPTDD